MVTLANLRPEDLVVDPTPAVQAIGQGVGDVLVNRAQEQVFSGTTSPAQKREAFLRISKLNPAFGKVVLNLLEKQEALKLKQIGDQTDEQVRLAILLERQTGAVIEAKKGVPARNIKHEKQVRILQDKAVEAVELGEDPSELLRMAELDVDQLQAKIDETKIQGQDLKTLLQPNIKEPDPGQFTPASLAEFARTQDFSVLEGVTDVQTEPAKRIIDQRLVNESFGENSPEAQALRAAFKAKDKPEVAPGTIAGLRSQFAARSQEFITAKAALKKVITSEATPIGDLAKTVAFMKTIDPRSAVLQGEQATAQNAGSVPDRVINLYNRLLGTGEKLTATQRANMDNQALKNFNALVPAQRQLQKFFTDTSKRQGVDPRDVVLDLIDTRGQGGPPPGPTAGAAGPAGGAPTVAAGAAGTTALDDLREFQIGKFNVKVKN